MALLTERHECVGIGAHLGGKTIGHVEDRKDGLAKSCRHHYQPGRVLKPLANLCNMLKQGFLKW